MKQKNVDAGAFLFYNSNYILSSLNVETIKNLETFFRFI